MMWRAASAALYVVLMHTAIVADITWLRVVALAVLLTLIHSAMPFRIIAVASWTASMLGLAALHLWGIEMWLAYLTPFIVHVAMCALFATSLRPGQVPLISRIATTMRSDLTPEILTYCRRLTIAWAALFALLTVMSVVLPLLDDPVLWSFSANFGNYLAVAVLFAAEYGYRRLRFPQQQHLSFRAHLRQVLATYPQAARRG